VNHRANGVRAAGLQIPFHLEHAARFYQSAAETSCCPAACLATNTWARYSRGDSGPERPSAATAASVFERVIAPARIPHGIATAWSLPATESLLHPSAVSPGSVPPLLEPLLAELADAGRSVFVTSLPDDPGH
jgi:hypothetical protein